MVVTLQRQGINSLVLAWVFYHPFDNYGYEAKNHSITFPYSFNTVLGMAGMPLSTTGSVDSGYWSVKCVANVGPSITGTSATFTFKCNHFSWILGY